jgi:hypothetical protein
VTPNEIRFCVAGLEVWLRADRPGGLDSLSGFYGQYPSSGAAPDLIIDIERVPGFARGRERGPEYPAFRRTLVAHDTIALSRFDAEGEIVLPAGDTGPVRAGFRVAESANSLEAAIRIGASIALPRRGGLILHASAVAAHGRAWIFAGVSGAGKSTIASLLAGASPELIKIADELIIIKPAATGAFAAHVTPFIGSQGLPHRASMPVAALHFLVQARQHRRVPVARPDAVRELLRHVLVYVAEPMTAGRVLAVASSLAGQVPCHRLEFENNARVVDVLGIAGQDTPQNTP